MLMRLGIAIVATGLSLTAGEAIVRNVVPEQVPLRFDEFVLENTVRGGFWSPTSTCGASGRICAFPRMVRGFSG